MERTKDVPGISLVVPVYNVQEYLPECLDSLLGQSFAAIEIILVDDGSTDASAEICDRYAARDGRIRVVHQQNAGVSKARNVGIRLARGKYLGFVDGDDWVDRDYCKRLYETLIDYRADISICSYYVARSRKTKPEAADGKITIYDRKEAIRMLYEDVRIRSFSWNKLFRRELFDGIGFPEDRIMCEDMAIMHKLFYRTGAVVQMNVPLYYYRMRGDSCTNEMSHPLKEYQFFLAVCEQALFEKEKNLLPEERGKLEAKVLKRAIRLIGRIVSRENYTAYESLYGDVIARMHGYDHLGIGRIGIGVCLRRKMIYDHFDGYANLIRSCRKLTGRKCR